MRRLLFVAATATTLLALTGIAVAENQYGLINSGTGKGTGTAAKPVPVKASFGFTIKDSVEANRATPVRTYLLASEGLVAYPKLFPRCKFSDTEAGTLQAVLAKCKKAVVGGGVVLNYAGAQSNIMDKGSRCNLKLTVINIGDGLALRLDGDPPPPTAAEPKALGCTIPLHASIKTKFVKAKVNGMPSSALKWTTPDTLIFPLPGIESYAWEATLNVSKKTATTKIKGKKRKVGYYSSVGCGKDKKRLIQVTFTTVKGAKETKKTSVKC